MADVPVIFKKAKSKPGVRGRTSTPDITDATVDSESREESPSTLATKLKKKSRAKPKSRLSFGGDEPEGDEEVFQLKKSNLSRKLALGTHPASTSVLTSNYDPTATPSKSNGGPTYDAAYLSELKAKTPSARPPAPVDDSMSYDADISLDADGLQHSALTSIGDISDLDAGTSIPSGSSILAAKQKRERLRTAAVSGEEDFISLSVSKRSEFSQGPHPESRLMREEDELGDADDEFADYTSAQERIALGKKSRKLEAKKRRDEMNEMIADAEEEDEETIEWEQEQLRRTGIRAEEYAPAAQKPVYKPAPIPAITQIPTLGAAVARLTQSLTALTTSHAQNSASMASLGEEQLMLEAREKEMREMIAKAEEKRSWFAAFREWVESVATFLDEKYPQLETLEDEHLSILKERADMISTRRQAEDEDDLSLFLGTLPQPASEPEVDELGRVTPRANPTVTRRERLAARSTRRSLRHALKRGGDQQEEEGYSTDSSLALTDAVDYETALTRLKRRATEVMADVAADEFKDPARGLSKWFGEWRDKFGDSYTGAWGGLGMVGAWEFWVRLEILGWSPLEDTRNLDSFTWYHSLYQYSHRQAADIEEEPEPGPNGDLVSAMISSAVIPRLCKLIEGGGFDPYSGRDVRKLTDLVEQIEASVEKGSLKYELLLKAIFSAFQDAVSSSETLAVTYLALNNPRFDPEAIPARRRYLARRYKLLRDLINWRKYTGERFGVGTLVKRLVDNCMLPVAESGWEVGGEDCMRKVAGALPNELVSSELRNRIGNA
ncbi:hypothetical protein CERSUDRAFT_81377 [Gelatoporia subvermispora B]|uniref:GCF C-terminal domain-containing protein n=1 Tax=Ceriporiopsis subvermispora (strain B) TaxID=914234 RepID=M2QST2_CERS8|nr:hypothetical protein CERSUDRAFT_81377 [Gelatoporia subvermispora B]